MQGALKRRRKAEGWTQEQLAEQVSCSTITLRKIEAEERRPSAQIVERLAEIFNIPPNEQAGFLRFARGDWKSMPSETKQDFPWRASTKSPRSNLPARFTSLIGRKKAIADIRGYFQRPDIRLVTLTGEVRYPGSYSIAKGERLSSLIARAGGRRRGSDSGGGS